MEYQMTNPNKNKTTTYVFTFTEEESTEPQHYRTVLRKIDKTYKDRYGYPEHSTTLEIITDAVFEILKKKSKVVLNDQSK